MEIEKKISIALATYNGAKYLAPYLDSLFCQTLQPNEVVVVDDCSNDDTVKILQEYSDRLPIKVFVNEKNLGVNKNFEKAVSLCSGDFILLSDQDDIWLPNNIERKVEILKSMPLNQPAFVGSFSTLVDQNLKEIMKFRPNGISNDNNFECFLTPYQGTTVAFNRKLKSLFPKWPDDFRLYPYDVFIRFVAVLSGNVYNLKESLMLYRYHTDNVFLSTSKISLFIKRINLFYQLAKIGQNALSCDRLDRIGKILKIIEIGQNKGFYNRLCMCREKDRFLYMKFLMMDGISLNLKIKVFVANLISHFKKK